MAFGMHDERVNCEIVYGTGLSFIPDIFSYVQYYGLLPSITDRMEDSLPSRSLYDSYVFIRDDKSLSSSEEGKL